MAQTPRDENPAPHVAIPPPQNRQDMFIFKPAYFDELVAKFDPHLSLSNEAKECLNKIGMEFLCDILKETLEVLRTKPNEKKKFDIGKEISFILQNQYDMLLPGAIISIGQSDNFPIPNKVRAPTQEYTNNYLKPVQEYLKNRGPDE